MSPGATRRWTPSVVALCAFVGAVAGPTLSRVAASSPPRQDLPPDEVILARLYVLLDLATIAEFADSALIPASDLTSCMTDAGFEYTVYDMTADDPRYVLSPAEYASEYGLGVTRRVIGRYPEPRTDDIEYLASLTAEDRQRFFDSERECAAQLDASWTLSFQAAEEVSVESFREVVDSDARSIAALRRWDACMTERGYDYESPAQMRLVFSGLAQRLDSGDRAGADALIASEVDVATANLDCEPSYNAVRREVVAARFDEYKDLLVRTYSTDVAPGDVG